MVRCCTTELGVRWCRSYSSVSGTAGTCGVVAVPGVFAAESNSLNGRSPSSHEDEQEETTGEWTSAAGMSGCTSSDCRRKNWIYC